MKPVVELSVAVMACCIFSLAAVGEQGAGNGIPSGYVLVKPGSFVMGSTKSEQGRKGDEVQHKVTITRPFFLKATEVTQAEWKAIMGNNPSHFTSCGGDCPVERVTWKAAIAYCNALSKKEGLEECYDGTGFKGLSCKGYRLPTAAEWEYAARAGTTTARYGKLEDIAWYENNSNRTPHPVAKKKPNALGLYDMIGNVWEWVQDFYAPYPKEDTKDPIGAVSGRAHEYRGCGWSSAEDYCRAAFRGRFNVSSKDVLGATGREDILGFRPARTAE